MPADRTEQSAYERICADACEWCAKGIPLYAGKGIHHAGHGLADPRCTARSRDAVIDSQSAELAQGHEAYRRLCDSLETAVAELAALKQERGDLRADKERLDWILRMLWEHGAFGLADRLLVQWDATNTYDRATFDAARTAQQDVNPGVQSRIQGVKQ